MKLCPFVQSVFHVFNVPKSIFKYVEGRIPKCVNGKVIHDYVDLMVNDKKKLQCGMIIGQLLNKSKQLV